jgi:hypothetical protein
MTLKMRRQPGDRTSPYCPRNGCPVLGPKAGPRKNRPVCMMTCKACGKTYDTANNRLCVHCHMCPWCKRPGKEFYLEAQIEDAG